MWLFQLFQVDFKEDSYGFAVPQVYTFNPPGSEFPGIRNMGKVTSYILFKITSIYVLTTGFR